MISRIGYWSYYAASWIIWALPLRIAYGISDIFCFIAYNVVRYRIKVVRANLKNAFPEKSTEELCRIERKFYHHLCDLFIESMQLMHMRDHEAKKRFKYINIDVINQCYEQKRNVMVVLGHYGNWETNITFSLWSQFKSLATYKKINDPYFNSQMQKNRQKFGLEVVSMHKTFKRVLECVKSGEPTIVALIADQAPMPDESDFWVPFLNQESAIFMGPEKIAKKIDAVVFFAKLTKPRRGYYNIEMIRLFDDAKNTPTGKITIEHVKELERIIRETPEYWLWSHRRWKRKRPAGVEMQYTNE